MEQKLVNETVVVRESLLDLHDILMDTVQADEDTLIAATNIAVEQNGVLLVARMLTHLRKMQCNPRRALVAAAALTPFLQNRDWAKNFFTVGKGVLQNLGEGLLVMEYYVRQECNRRGVTSFQNIPYPNSIRKGIKASMEAASVGDFIESKYPEGNFEFLDAIRYFHPDPRKEGLCIEVGVVDYIKHLGTLAYLKDFPEKRAAMEEKAMNESIDGVYATDIFHAIMFNIIELKENGKHHTEFPIIKDDLKEFKDELNKIKF